MRRKVIKQRDSYTVTLPIKWIKAKGIKPGDEIDLDIESGRVVIDSEAHPEFESARISDVENKNVIPIVGTAYRSGYLNISLALKKEAKITELQETLDFFNGLEIEEIKGKEAKLRCVAPASADEYDFFVRKMFLTIKMMIDEIIKYFDGEKLDIHAVEGLRKNNLKAREFCMRSINVQKITKKGAADEYTFIYILEKISGNLWHIGRYIDWNNVKRSKKTKEMLVWLKDIADKSYHVYLKKDYGMGVREILSLKDMRSEWFRQGKIINAYKKDGTDPAILLMIIDIKDRIYEAIANFLTTIIKTD